MEENIQNFKMGAEGDEMTGYYYNMLMSSMNVSVSKHLMDEYFTVIWANDYFYERTLYTKEEYEAIYENRCSDYFKQDPAEYAKFESAILEAVEKGEPGYDAICKMPQKGGSYIWIKITGRFSEEKINGIPVIYSVFTDVTKAVEQQELQEQLEKQSEQLRIALDQAEAANREKTDFLSRMSHDIRTPMNAIMGMTDIASENLGNPVKMQDCLRKISLSSQHLLGLINDVLDMSKIESGKMSLSKNEILLSEVMENIVAIMQPQIKEKMQQFDVRLYCMEHEHFYCDSLRLRQVLINILSNASKFTPAGGNIWFEVEEKDTDDDEQTWIEFRIYDTGIGIRPEFIEHIFEPFSREMDSRVDKTEGSGLGMAITRKIVELMGGKIQVQSKLGEGTIFKVWVPLEICTEETQEYSFDGLKVIIIDDDEIICEHTTQIMEKMGVKAEWETDGAAAVSKIKAAHEADKDYDAAILDWKMPGLNGMEIARTIRNEVGEEIPILLISSYDWSDIEEEAMAVGVNGFIMKPIFLSTICSALQKYVVGKSSDRDGFTAKLDFSGKRFLLVEDNELNREIAVELLASSGAEIEYACDGAEGMEKFKQSQENDYDLILMDVQMPVMNGYEATRQIRALDRADALTIPILAMTADAFAEDIADAKNAGMNGHLAKPLDRATLIREIGKYI